MQLVVQAICSPGRSLRDAIVRDARLADFDLVVREGRRVGRRPGWTKLHAVDRAPGAVNLEWDGDAAVLVARVVSRGRHRPSKVVARLVDYLVDRHHRRILTITVVPR
jgi:hypothetical protein